MQVSTFSCCYWDRRSFSLPLILPTLVALQGQRHTHESSTGARSEQLGRDTPDLYPDERDPNTRDRGEHEDRGLGIRKPSETAPERTSNGDQDGRDVDDLVQSGRGGGKSWCSGCTSVRIDRCY